MTENDKLPFSSLALRKELVDALRDSGFSGLSPIQAKAIPPLLQGRSVLGLAPTGTGKTLAYLVPILNDLKADGHVQAIILSPTVALLGQIREVLLGLAGKLNLPSDAIRGIFSQADFTRSHPLIVLTTPNLYQPLLSHYPVNELKRVIIDEGDMIAFDGFSSMLSALQKPAQKGLVSFFSASLPVQSILAVKKEFHIAEVVDLRTSITNPAVKHHLLNIRGLSKAEALEVFLRTQKPFRTIAFVSTKKDLYTIAETLTADGLRPLILHGDLDKREIKNVIKEFSQDDGGLLLASDYASRGLDLPDVSTIVSVDLPMDLDYYFHRAGRAGRFDRPGDSFVFYTEDDPDSVAAVKDLIRRKVSFDSATLSTGGVKNAQGGYVFRNLGKKDQSNPKLQKQIRHAIAKVRTTEVKPNYRKRVAKAVQKVKFKHRQKVVLTNIARAGGNVQDFHIERYDKKKRRH
jgi:ATP-dependent RNA helicase CshB